MSHPRDPWLDSLDKSTLIESSSAPEPDAIRSTALTILAHPDVSRVGARVFLPALDSGRQVRVSRREPRFQQPASDAQADTPRPLADPRLSRTPITLEPADADAVGVARGGYSGTIEVDGVALGEHIRVDAQRLATGVTLLLGDRVALLLHRAHPDVGPDFDRGIEGDLGMVGHSDAMRTLRAAIREFGPSDIAALIEGETGSGKELVAAALHRASPRRRHPFIAINMAAIPPSLATAELFGAARGAFTGADRPRRGHFARADGGTLFLDEVGETPADLQPMLLRTLESGEVQPIGGGAEIVDVRLVAATDADLEQAVAEGNFRAPLLFRLRGARLRVAPLRERRDDIARLLLHFLREELASVGADERLDDPGPRGNAWLTAPLVARLVRAAWPGNVRQLRQLAHRLALSGRDRATAHVDPHTLAEIDSPVRPPPSDGGDETMGEDESPRATAPRPRYRSPTEIDDETLIETLRAQRWRVRPTAEALGISRTALYSLIERCPQIRKASDLTAVEIRDAIDAAQGDLDAASAQLEVSRHGLLLRMRELEIARR